MFDELRESPPDFVRDNNPTEPPPSRRATPTKQECCNRFWEAVARQHASNLLRRVQEVADETVARPVVGDD